MFPMLTQTPFHHPLGERSGLAFQHTKGSIEEFSHFGKFFSDAIFDETIHTSSLGRQPVLASSVHFASESLPSVNDLPFGPSEYPNQEGIVSPNTLDSERIITIPFFGLEQQRPDVRPLKIDTPSSNLPISPRKSFPISPLQLDIDVSVQGSKNNVPNPELDVKIDQPGFKIDIAQAPQKLLVSSQPVLPETAAPNNLPINRLELATPSFSQIEVGAPQIELPSDPVRASQRIVTQVTDFIRVHQIQKSIEVQLSPPHLGQLNIEFDFGVEGNLKAIVSASEHETLSLLRRQSHLLEKELMNLGFSETSIEFSENSTSQQDHNSDVDIGEIIIPAITTRMEQVSASTHNGKLDIQL